MGGGVEAPWGRGGVFAGGFRPFLKDGFLGRFLGRNKKKHACGSAGKKRRLVGSLREREMKHIFKDVCGGTESNLRGMDSFLLQKKKRWMEREA